MLKDFFHHPLRLALGERQLVFDGIAEFEFALCSRTEVPSGKVSALIRLDADELRDEAGRIRQIERHLVEVLAQSLEEPGTIGGLLRELDIQLFSNDHEWRSLIEALLTCEHRFDDFKQLALVKYVQYLAARQDVLKTLYQGKKQRAKKVGARPEPSARDGLGATVIFDLSQPPADSRGGALRRLPVGEPVVLRLPASGEVDINLSRHRFKIVVTRRFYLVDDAGRDYPLRRGRNLVGRQAGSDVVIDASYRDVSRKHLIIEIGEADEVRVTDLSSHGSFVHTTATVAA